MLYLETFTFNPFQENTYILYDDTKEAVIFDPGCYEKHEQEELTDFIKDKNLHVTKLINTHCHIDHVLGNAFVKRQYGVKLYIHENELPVLTSVKVYAPNYGFGGYDEAEADDYLSEGDTLRFGETEMEILWVPGHAPGHLVFFHRPSGICVAGDTLFRGSIGRTDLPGGDHNTLLEAIANKLFTLPEDTTIYPGHGPVTTVGYEKRYNPFVGSGGQ